LNLGGDKYRRLEVSNNFVRVKSSVQFVKVVLRPLGGWRRARGGGGHYVRVFATRRGRGGFAKDGEEKGRRAARAGARRPLEWRFAGVPVGAAGARMTPAAKWAVVMERAVSDGCG